MMTIECKARAYRGVERADVDVAPIALLAGANGAGKTSFAQAIGSVLTSEAIPMRGVNKSAAGVLVRSSEAAGAATVQSDSGTARMDWPACSRRTEKEPPEASRYAAGLASVVELAPAERVRFLSDLLHADPSRDDLHLALMDFSELDADAITAAIWERIERQGWDATVIERRDRGAEFKGQWRQITGQNYGSRIAASYRQDLADERRSEAELMADVDEARGVLERAIGAAASSNVEREKLQAKAAQVGDCTNALRLAAAAVADAESVLAQAVERRNALPPATDDRHVACPACGVLLVVRPGDHLLANPVLVEAKEPTSENEMKARRMAIAVEDGKVDNAKGVLSAAQRTQAEARVALQAAQDAKQELDALPPPAETAIDVEQARQLVATNEEYLVAVRTKRRADEVAARIAANDIVIDILAPDGLRAKKLGQVVDAYNRGILAPLCDAGGWRAVTIDPNFEIAYGGRHYALLSASEQFRVRAILQVAIAQSDGSAMVIIDAADILDGPARGALFDMLAKSEVPALVCMTLSRREQTPDLAAASMGKSYWIEAGVAAPIGTPAQAAA